MDESLNKLIELRDELNKTESGRAIIAQVVEDLKAGKFNSPSNDGDTEFATVGDIA